MMTHDDLRWFMVIHDDMRIHGSKILDFVYASKGFSGYPSHVLES